MSFQPSAKITGVAKDSSFLTVTDTTPVASSDYSQGYGAAGAPVNFAGISNVQIQFRYLSDTTDTVVNLSGTLDTGLKITTGLRDGVQNISVLYGVVPTATATLDATGLIVTLTPTSGMLNDLLLTATHFSIPGGNAIKILSKDFTAGTITLEKAIASIPDPAQTVLYYTATVLGLIITSGQAAILTDIANMAIQKCSCDYSQSKNLIERIILKLAAQTAFNNGNYVKAHNAAILLNKAGTATKPCAC